MASWKKVELSSYLGWVEDTTIKDTSNEEKLALSEWWGNKTCMPWFTFLNQLPLEIQSIVLGYLSPIIDIFIKEVIEKEKTFRLYTTCTEIHYGPVWRWRPEIRKYRDENGSWHCDYKKRYDGGGWGHDGNNINYERGSMVPLWWIRHKQHRSPFHILTNRFVKCGDNECSEDGVSMQGYCPNYNCKWVEDIIWGAGPTQEDLDIHCKSNVFMNEYEVNCKYVLKNPTECDEVSFRKNLCCMALKNGCDCGNMLSFRNHFNKIPSFKNVGFGQGPRRAGLKPWYKHQVQDPKKKCQECILRNKSIYGDKADMYETRCVFTRKKLLNEICVELSKELNEETVIIYTNRLPRLKHKNKSRKQLRKIRNFNRGSCNVGRSNKNIRNSKSQHKLCGR